MGINLLHLGLMYTSKNGRSARGIALSGHTAAGGADVVDCVCKGAWHELHLKASYFIAVASVANALNAVLRERLHMHVGQRTTRSQCSRNFQLRVS
jgi:hypothetical protein